MHTAINILKRELESLSHEYIRIVRAVGASKAEPQQQDALDRIKLYMRDMESKIMIHNELNN